MIHKLLFTHLCIFFALLYQILKNVSIELQKTLPGLAVIGLACIVGGVVSAHGQKIVTSGIVIFTAVFLHNTLGYTLGYLTGLLF
jgi:BASS family bile acid:Na+ symporter